MSGFVQRAIDLQFTRVKPQTQGSGAPTVSTGPQNNPTFADTGTNQLRVSGLRVSCEVEHQGVLSASARLRIFGLSRSLMNDLSTLGMLVYEAQYRNTVTVFAGETGQTLALVYSGGIVQAFADFRGMPDVGFEIVSQGAGFDAIAPVPAISQAGSVDVVQLLGALAKQLNLTLRNGGVSGVRLADPYFPGTAIDQVRAIADHAGINIAIDGGEMAIWPAGGLRPGTVPLISAATTLIGYPAYSQTGLDLETRYDPNAKVGGLIQVQSELAQASGSWMVYSLVHHLEAQTPGGAWSSQLQVAVPGSPVVISSA